MREGYQRVSRRPAKPFAPEPQKRVTVGVVLVREAIWGGASRIAMAPREENIAAPTTALLK